MVWLFGGAFQFGSGGSATTKYYDGEQLVKTGKVVVVTINYRVGPLGFFTHPALTADAATSGAPANFGILDQRLALQWVQDNIAAFGGDKTKVTVFGQSAGGNSVCIHLLSEGSRGLFSRAIVQSGLCMKHALTLAESEARGKRFAAGLGCTDDSQVLSCLRNLGADKITTGPADKSKGPGGVFFQDPSQDYFFQPVIDQRVLNEQLEPAFAAGRIVNKVPVLHGATTSEGIIFIDATLGATPVTSATEYQTALNNRFGARTADVIAKYPNFATDLSKINADAFFRCPAIRMAKYLSDAGIKNYLYRFNLYLMSAIPALKDQAFHSVEIPYIFGTSTFALGLVPADSTDASQTIMGYWTRFAAAGDPNGGSAPTWPSYDPTSHSFMNFETPIALGTTGWDDGCDFWENIPITAP
jgi:para-nitrobenzyl esterase